MRLNGAAQHLGRLLQPASTVDIRIGIAAPNPPFLRVHRSHIVNLDQVERMVSLDDSRLEVRMKSGAKVPVSRIRSQEIRRRAR